MSTDVRPIPDGFTTVTPYLTVSSAAEAIPFYEKAFGAHELFRNAAGDRIMHAQVMIGDSIVMMSDEFPDYGCLGPQPGTRSPVTIHLYVENVDDVFAQAVEAGAEVVMPVQDMFWGDRFGTVKDPFGHLWSISTHIEDLTPQEIEERGKNAFGG